MIQTAINVMIGLFIGGAIGVGTMCFAKAAQCGDCPYRGSRVNRDGK